MTVLFFFGPLTDYQFSIFAAIYGFLYLPSGWRALMDPLDTELVGHDNAVPLVLIIGLSFFTNLGVGAIPWMLLSEVFPFK